MPCERDISGVSFLGSSVAALLISIKLAYKDEEEDEEEDKA